MKKRHSLRNQKGFTLIELISIMIILGVLGSVAIRKYDNLTNTANESVLAVTVEELNARERLNRNRLFLIESTLQTQLQVNGNYSRFYKKDLFGLNKLFQYMPS
jgi:prepilin-type N-terminal cleavage/methylation domain-containing protein